MKWGAEGGDGGLKSGMLQGLASWQPAEHLWPQGRAVLQVSWQVGQAP